MLVQLYKSGKGASAERTISAIGWAGHKDAMPVLVDVLKNNGHLPAVGIKEAILDAVKVHTVGMRQSDDITLIVVRRME